MERDYPYPIIFGAVDPQNPFPVLNIKTEGRETRIFSRTNYNLFLEPQDAKHLTIGALLKKLGREITSQCDGCHKEFGWCRLIYESVAGEWWNIEKTGELPPSASPENYFRQYKIGLGWHNCKVYELLLNICETNAERKFLEQYLLAVGLKLRMKGVEDAYLKKREPDFTNIRTLWDFTECLLDDLQYPALIPQVWLNFIWDKSLGVFDPERGYLDENPSRVDFIMLTDQQKHVIEIDDPGHYATFREGKYTVNEEQYTKNLRIDRRLKWDGWIVHRFSRWEVRSAFNIDYFMAVLGLWEHQGIRADPCQHGRFFMNWLLKEEST